MGLNQIGYKKVTAKNIIGDIGNSSGGGGASVSVNSSTSTITSMYVTLVQTTLSGAQTVDGASPSNGDSILVANQTDAKENGIYTYSSSGAWERVDGLGSGNQITILGGTKQGTIWVVETASFEIGTDNISIIENAISRKDESFSLGFDAVSSLMSMDKFIIQASDNVLRSAEINDIFDTYGARGDWDAVTIKTADTRVTGETFTDVDDITIDLDADSEYEFELISLATSKVDVVLGKIPIQFLYSGTFEYGEFSTNGSYDSSGGGINTTNRYVYANTNNSDITITPFSDFVNGIIKTTTSGTLKVQTKGYSVSNISTIHAGSVFKVKKLDTFTNFQPSSGEANTGTNVGGEKEVYKSMSGTALQFRTLKEGTGVTLTQNTDDITIDVAGGGFYDGSVHLTSDASITGTTWTDVGLSVSLDATSTYIVKLMLYQDTNSDTFNPYSRFQYSGTIDYSGYTHSGSTTPTVGITTQILGAYGVAKGNTITVDAMITTTTSGDLKVQHKGDTGKTAYLRKGSILYYKKVV